MPIGRWLWSASSSGQRRLARGPISWRIGSGLCPASTLNSRPECRELSQGEPACMIYPKQGNIGPACATVPGLEDSCCAQVDTTFITCPVPKASDASWAVGCGRRVAASHFCGGTLTVILQERHSRLIKNLNMISVRICQLNTNHRK